MLSRGDAAMSMRDSVAEILGADMTLPAYAMNQATFPEMYERWLVTPLFAPWAQTTLDEVRLSSGDHLLDIACGTGIVARSAGKRLDETGYIVGIDLSSDMLAVARAIAPDIDWREGNAVTLPLHDGEQFDVVVCQQGLQFFPDKAAAAAQMRRALAAGGRLAVSTWRSDDEIPFFRALRDVAEHHLGPIADLRHSFGDAATLQELLRNAGFHDVGSRVMSHMIRFEDGAPLLRMNTMALVGMSASGRAMDDQERKQVVENIVSESKPVMELYADGSGIAFELSANLATARA
jgi:ubiquinone/menaquinone biosynthesis C-methylase UbiE